MFSITLLRIVPIVLGGYALLDSLSPRGMPYWTLVYGFSFIAIILGVLPTVVKRFRLEQSHVPVVLLGTIIVLSGVAMSFWSGEINYPMYLLSDLVKDLFICLFAILFLTKYELSERDLSILLFFLVVGMLVAPFGEVIIGEKASSMGTRFESSGRYEPPHWFLPSLIIFGVSTARGNVSFLWIFAYLLAMGLALFSQQRLNFLQFFLAPIVFLFAVKRLPRLSTILSAFGLSAIIGLGGVLALNANNSNSGVEALVKVLRLREVLEQGNDRSSSNRILEAKDVVSHFERRGDSLNFLMGFGYGSTYAAKETKSTINLTDLDEVHHVHIGPFQVLLRHGLIGILALILLVAGLLVRVLRSSVHSSGVEVALNCALAASILQFCVFGNLHDPLLSVVWGWAFSKSVFKVYRRAI